MKVEVFSDADAVARQAAALIATEARAAVAARGRFVVAVSGGHTPWAMLRALSGEDVPWPNVYVTQVDERVAPAGDPDRNLTHIRENLRAPLASEQILAMPVEAPESASSGCTIRRKPSGDCRFVAGARPGSPRSWAGRSYGVVGSGRSRPRSYGRGRCAYRHLSRKTSNDPDVPDDQSIASHSVACDRE